MRTCNKVVDADLQQGRRRGPATGSALTSRPATAAVAAAAAAAAAAQGQGRRAERGRVGVLAVCAPHGVWVGFKMAGCFEQSPGEAQKVGGEARVLSLGEKTLIQNRGPGSGLSGAIVGHVGTTRFLAEVDGIHVPKKKKPEAQPSRYPKVKWSVLERPLGTI